jgi:hypothetical protein
MSYQGRFYPKNKQKYKGDSNNIIYRSLWERKFMNYCDLTESVIEWQSEEIIIPYLSPLDNKVHRYFPDFLIKIKENAGEIKTYLIEIKPKSQTVEPDKNPKRRTKRWINEIYTWNVNQAKWKAAEEYCKDRLYEFKILTEKELGIWQKKKNQ